MSPGGFAQLLLVCLAAAPALAQTATFSSKVEAVRVDVLVTQNGQPVRGIQPAEFEVLDNGVPQRVDLASFEEIPLNVVLVLDMSSSVEGARLEHLKAAARDVLSGLTANDQVGLVTFGHAVAVRSPLTTDLERVRATLDAATPHGDTSLFDAAYAGLLLGESDVGRSLVIVFSDGLDTASWLRPELVLQTGRRSDAVVYGVMLRSTLRPEFLRDLTEATGGDLLQIESTSHLGGTFTRILQEFRYRYLVSYTPNDVPRTGWHQLQVRVKRRGATVKARPGYLAGTPEGDR